MDKQALDLIEQYIERDPHRPTPEEALVKPSLVKLWAVIGHLQSLDGDVGRTARGYDLPEAAVRAVMAYYEIYHELIDNRLKRNASSMVHAYQQTD